MGSESFFPILEPVAARAREISLLVSASCDNCAEEVCLFLWGWLGTCCLGCQPLIDSIVLPANISTLLVCCRLHLTPGSCHSSLLSPRARGLRAPQMRMFCVIRGPLARESWSDSRDLQLSPWHLASAWISATLSDPRRHSNRSRSLSLWGTVASRPSPPRRTLTCAMLNTLHTN